MLPQQANGLVSPEHRRKEYQQGKNLQPPQQHAETENPFGGTADATVVGSHILQTGAQVIQTGGYR